ncbi:MAG: hypothetical protein B7Y09_21790 [Polaromonas sp. 24-63-21]|nr:MAG: hypothetical protein B7Y09_21790 [Polaromonas sp. 24-63-21]
MLDRSAAQLLRVARVGGALQVLFGLDVGLDLLLFVGLGLFAFAGCRAVALAGFIGGLEGVADGQQATQRGDGDGRLGVNAQRCCGGRDHEQLPAPHEA